MRALCRTIHILINVSSTINDLTQSVNGAGIRSKFNQLKCHEPASESEKTTLVKEKRKLNIDEFYTGQKFVSASEEKEIIRSNPTTSKKEKKSIRTDESYAGQKSRSTSRETKLRRLCGKTFDKEKKKLNFMSLTLVKSFNRHPKRRKP